MSSSNRGTKSASADEPQIVRRTDKRHGNKVRESKRSLAGHSCGSKVRNSKDSLAGPSHGAKAEEPKIARSNEKALESFFRSLHGDEPFVMSKSDTIFIGCHHDRIEDDIDDDSSSPGSHEEEEWIPVDRYVWKPQLDPKKRCIAAAPGDN